MPVDPNRRHLVLQQALNRSLDNITDSTPADTKEKSWLDYHPTEYVNSVGKWEFALAHYSGDLLDPAVVADYLFIKGQSESPEAYTERALLADYTPMFSTLIDSLAGMLFQVEERAVRRFGTESSEGLGDPKISGTIMHRLWRDIDGRGTDYMAFWKQVVIELVVTHKAWLIADTTKDDDTKAVLRMWPASRVVNWLYDGDTLTHALVKHWVDSRRSLQDDPDLIPEWIEYTLFGWQRWRKDDKGKPIKVGELTRHNFFNESGDRILPIFPITLPMKRNVGWMMARKANVIFNKESERDALLRTANFPYLNLVASDKQFSAITQKMSKGSRALQVDPAHRGKAHHFIAPSAESAKIATDVLRRKVEEFFMSGFREYGDSSRDRVTATEVRQDVSSGVGAFLQLLKSGVDEAENGALLRIAQIELPNAKSRWFINTVERSDDFVPVDLDNEIEQLKKRYFGESGVVPVGVQAMIAAAKRIAQWDGLEAEDGQVESAVVVAMMSGMLEAFRELPVPPQAKAEYVVAMLKAHGQIPDVEVELEDGEKIKLVDLVRQRAEDMAEQQDAMNNALLNAASAPPGGDVSDATGSE